MITCLNMKYNIKTYLVWLSVIATIRKGVKRAFDIFGHCTRLAMRWDEYNFAVHSAVRIYHKTNMCSTSKWVIDWIVTKKFVFKFIFSIRNYMDKMANSICFIFIYYIVQLATSVSKSKSAWNIYYYREICFIFERYTMWYSTFKIVINNIAISFHPFEQTQGTWTTTPLTLSRDQT